MEEALLVSWEASGSSINNTRRKDTSAHFDRRSEAITRGSPYQKAATFIDLVITPFFTISNEGWRLYWKSRLTRLKELGLLFLLFSSWLAYVSFEDTQQGKRYLLHMVPHCIKCLYCSPLPITQMFGNLHTKQSREGEKDKDKEMKNMKGQVLLNLPAEKAWEMYRNNEIISKINPQMLVHSEYIQGDGSPGSVRLFKLGPAVHSYVKESTEKIEKLEKGRSVTYRVVDGDLREMYDPYRVTFSFIPMEGKENEMCIAEWKAEFETLAPTTPPPEKARDAALGFLKWFDKCQLSY